MRANDDGAPAEGPLDPHLEAAHDALEAGRPEHALAEAAASTDAEGRALLEVRAHLALGHLQAAEGALERAASLMGEDDLDVLVPLVAIHEVLGPDHPELLEVREEDDHVVPARRLEQERPQRLEGRGDGRTVVPRARSLLDGVVVHVHQHGLAVTRTAAPADDDQ